MRLKNKRLILVFTVLCLWTQGNASHKPHKVKKKSGHDNTVRKNIPRSALVGIKPEELTENPASLQDVQGANKGYMKIVDLPSMEESQRMAAFSSKVSKLPAGEKGVINDFLKDMDRSHGELTPSVMKKMVQLEAYNPAMNRHHNQRGLHLTRGRAHDSQGSQRSFGFNPEPTNALNPSVLPFKLSGSSATYSSTESDVGEETQSYLSNPLPEYDYKETKYNLPTSLGNDFSEGYHNNNDEEEYSKNLDQDYEAENKAEDLEGDYNKPQNPIATLVGKKGDNLINEIGRRVLLNILEKQKQKNDYERFNGKGVPDLLGAASMDSKEIASPIIGGDSNSVLSPKDTSFVASPEQDSLLQNRNIELQKELSLKQAAQAMSPGSSNVAKAIADLGAKALGNTKLITQSAQTPIENELNANFDAPASPGLPIGNKVDVTGKINNVIDSKSFQPTTKVTTITTAATTPTKTMSTTSKILSSVGRTISTDNTASSNDDVVMLKISGQGKPVSFKADASTDGSIVLKIPKKYSEKIIETNEKTTMAKSNNANSKSVAAITHPGDLSGDASALLAGNTQLQDAPQSGSFVISGKKNPLKDIQGMHPTRNVMPPEEEKEIVTGESKTSDELLQSLNNWKEKFNTLASRQNLQQASTALPVPQDSSSLSDTPQDIAESVFPNVAGKPLNSPNMEQLMTLLAHMEQLPATQLGATPFDGMIPTNYGLRQTVGRQDRGAFSLKNLLKASKVMQDSGVTRNKGTQKESKKGSGNEWSPCTVTCGRGIQARARPCSGHDCSGFTTESRPCNAGPCPEQLAKEGLKLHNKFRKWHGVPALKWSPSLAKKAQKLAQDLALNNDSAMESVEMNELPGENTAKIENDYTTAAETAVKKWYEEVKSYSFAHPSLADSTKHFSQVVWKGTKKVGIGLAKSKSSNKTYVIALYDPSGNIVGKEKDNIQTPDMART